MASFIYRFTLFCLVEYGIGPKGGKIAHNFLSDSGKEDGYSGAIVARFLGITTSTVNRLAVAESSWRRLCMPGTGVNFWVKALSHLPVPIFIFHCNLNVSV